MLVLPAIALGGWAVGALVKRRQDARASAAPRRRSRAAWELPALSSLVTAPRRSESDLAAYATTLVGALSARGLDVRHVGTVEGPSTVRVELDLGAERVSRFTRLATDMAYSLGTSSVSLLTPVPGKAAVGVEIPRRERQTVRLGSVLASEPVRVLDVAVGITTDGAPLLANLTELPHLLIAGATGSGKSVFLNSLIVSLLMGASPADLELLLIDPKQVELAQYRGLPHLWRPIVTEDGDAIGALLATVDEMERRYKELAKRRFRDIGDARSKGFNLPYLVVIIDEIADLIMTARQYVEPAILRLAAKARAAGIHLVIATQRPSVKVITGDIKGNITARAAFQVASHTDSSVILDRTGAETLIGKGDLLFNDKLGMTRAQGAYVSDDEIGKVVSWWKSQR